MSYFEKWVIDLVVGYQLCSVLLTMDNELGRGKLFWTYIPAQVIYILRLRPVPSSLAGFAGFL